MVRLTLETSRTRKLVIDNQLECNQEAATFGDEAYFYYPELFIVESNFCYEN